LTLAEAAAIAPSRPGVYLFFGPGRTLVYVGKASSLRRRLADHARAPGGRLAAIYPLVDEVRWEEAPDDEAAAAREALLILALRPAHNASLADDGRWAYLRVSGDARFELLPEPRGGGRLYGCFPFLGVGIHSAPARACSDGYTAFLRLLWAAGGATGSSPPASFETPVGTQLRAGLHAFLTGTSDGLPRGLEPLLARREPYLQPGLRRDLEAAAGFFHHGPRALRDLRLRHGHRPRLLDRAAVERFLRAELEAAVGPFEVLEPEAAAPILGRRLARRRALGEARRRLEDAAAVRSVPPESAR
jgi:predicted GIY-YIG superfamily endonuclease